MLLDSSLMYYLVALWIKNFEKRWKIPGSQRFINPRTHAYPYAFVFLYSGFFQLRFEKGINFYLHKSVNWPHFAMYEQASRLLLYDVKFCYLCVLSFMYIMYRTILKTLTYQYGELPHDL